MCCAACAKDISNSTTPFSIRSYSSYSQKLPAKKKKVRSNSTNLNPSLLITHLKSWDVVINVDLLWL